MKIDTELEKNWNKILNLVRQEIAHSSFFDEYVKKMKIIDFSGNKLFINTNSKFAKVTLNENYKEIFKKICSDVLEKDVEVIFLSNKDEKEFVTYEFEMKNNFSDDLNTNLQKNYTFDNFVVGTHNAQAVLAVKKIFDGELPWNPIFIYGKTGLGKTHLLYAVGNRYLEENHGKRVKYIESNEYTQQVINAISEGNTAIELLKNEFKKLDLLLIDDIQFLATREKTNEIFFDVFNTLYHLNKVMVVTSDKPPEKLDGFAERMVSRFASGLTIKINLPDVSTLETIIKKKLIQMKLIDLFEPSAIKLLTNLYGNDIRKMNGALNSINFYIQTQNKKSRIDEKFIEKLINEQEVIRKINANYDPEIIIGRICRAFGTNVENIKSKKRNNEIVIVRQICMYILHKKLNLNLSQIGILLKRNHSTVISSVKKVEKLIKQNEEIREYVTTEKWKD